MELTEQGRYAIKNGSVKIRVRRSGMLQQLTFKIRKATVANMTYTELYTDRLVDTSECLRIATEIGLPVHSANASAFPRGTAASDFQNIANLKA